MLLGLRASDERGEVRAGRIRSSEVYHTVYVEWTHGVGALYTALGMSLMHGYVRYKGKNIMRMLSYTLRGSLCCSEQVKCNDQQASLDSKRMCYAIRNDVWLGWRARGDYTLLTVSRYCL